MCVYVYVLSHSKDQYKRSRAGVRKREIDEEKEEEDEEEEEEEDTAALNNLPK